jgi:hypothetical protein
MPTTEDSENRSIQQQPKNKHPVKLLIHQFLKKIMPAHKFEKWFFKFMKYSSYQIDVHFSGQAGGIRNDECCLPRYIWHPIYDTLFI